jgi:phosphatidylinositol 4-kinase type 2
MERLDAVEASLERLAVDNAVEEIEEDVGESSTAPLSIAAARGLTLSETALHASSSAPSRAGAPELAPVPEADSPTPSTLIEEHEEDDVALSKSLSHLDPGPLSADRHHGRGMSSHSAQNARRTLDWMHDEPARKRMVISEVRVINHTPFLSVIDLTLAQRLETVTKKPLLWC